MSIDSGENSYLEYISYSYTFYKNKLYLFWPYEWNLKLEVQCLIAGVVYNPKVVNKIVRVTTEIKENQINVWCDDLNYISKFNI